MKILVLGHRGMLGSDLMLRLAAAHEMTGIDIGDFDITAEDDCARVIAERSPEVVINAAAYTDVDGCETNRDRCFAVNAGGVKNIALACRGRGIRIVHFSTDYIFDGRKKTPYVETDLPAPLNVYGASKREGERFLEDFSDHWLLIRTAWLYGPNGNNFVRTMLRLFQERDEVKVVADQWGSPTLAGDLADAIHRAGQRVRYHDIPSDYGHDAFLLEHRAQTPLVRSFLDTVPTGGLVLEGLPAAPSFMTA